MSQTKSLDPLQVEIDDIYTLLTYALVYQDWQSDRIPREQRRGYNIGALLVDADREARFYGLNCINATDNATQHSEVRAIMGYLQKFKGFNLAGFTIYTSLEPCVMCAGMITMTAIDRAVYGQLDVTYSKAFERLSLVSDEIPPYPRQVAAMASNLSFRHQLDAAYATYLERGKEKILAKFLASEPARRIYAAATETFLSYEPAFPSNQSLLQKARAYWEQAGG